MFSAPYNQGMNTHQISLHNTAITVFYDGQCPICRLEVELYQKHASTGSIHWQDLSLLADDQLPQQKDRQTLLNRFHVLDRDESWHVGVDAFARIWRELPILRHFAFLFSLPGLRLIAEICYRGFLRWQRWHRKTRRS